MSPGGHLPRRQPAGSVGRLQSAQRRDVPHLSEHYRTQRSDGSAAQALIRALIDARQSPVSTTPGLFYADYSIPRNRRVDLSRPLIDTARHACRARESLFTEPHRHAQAAAAMMTMNDDVILLVCRQLADAIL